MIPFSYGWFDAKTSTFTDPETGDTRYVIVIDKTNDVTLPDELIIELAASSLGFGLNPSHIDWDRFYDMLETQYGYDMQGLGGRADNRIHRRVSQLRKEGEIGW